MATIISAGTTVGTGLAVTPDTSGNLAFQTQAGANTITVPNTTGTLLASDASGNAVAPALIPSGSTVPTNGIYLPSANTVGIATNSGNKWNVNSSGIVTAPYQPAFLATGTGGSITITSSANIPFNSLNTTFANANRNTGYNTSTYVYTAPVAGLYCFYAQIYVSTTCSVAWLKNGSQLQYQDISLFAFTNQSSVTQVKGGSIVVELAAGDSVGTRVRTGEANVSVYMGHSCFFGYLIG